MEYELIISPDKNELNVYTYQNDSFLEINL